MAFLELWVVFSLDCEYLGSFQQDVVLTWSLNIVLWSLSPPPSPQARKERNLRASLSLGHGANQRRETEAFIEAWTGSSCELLLLLHSTIDYEALRSSFRFSFQWPLPVLTRGAWPATRSRRPTSSRWGHFLDFLTQHSPLAVSLTIFRILTQCVTTTTIPAECASRVGSGLIIEVIRKKHLLL